MTAKTPPSPPEHLSENVSAVWSEIVAAHPAPSTIVGAELEVYCTLVATMRDAHERVAAEGLVVENQRGEAVPHPALAIERAAAREIRAWGDRFTPRGSATRRRGYMLDATDKSIKAAKHISDVHAGPVAAVRTLAWLIDEAQRQGIDAMQRAAFGAIPSYLKACDALHLTPASVPAPRPVVDGAKPVPEKPKTGRSGAVTALQDRAKERRGA